MVKDIIHGFLIMVFIITAVFAVSGIISVPFYYLAKYSCDDYGRRVGLKTDFSLINDCMVEVNGTWKPSKNTIEIK